VNTHGKGRCFTRADFYAPGTKCVLVSVILRLIIVQYMEHWKQPYLTNVMWLGLLFSILSITMLSFHQFDKGPPEYEGVADDLYELYRLRTAQCLIAGDVAKCLPYTLETLIHYTVAEHSRKYDSDRGLWLLAGLTVRAAVNMGYHREPSQTSNISKLYAELRRRVWSVVASLDLGTSFSVGFPSMIAAIDSDTLEPRNLHDWELSEDTTVLPPSRPLTELTFVTYLIVKSRIIRALGRITDFNNALKSGSYDMVLEIDRSLQEAYADVPPHMKLENTEPGASKNPSASTVSGLQMEFLYHQGLCALHRRFLSRGKLDPRYKLSRARCITSSLVLLAQQDILHRETRRTSRGSMPYWYKTSHTRHFFVVATMILCIFLEYRRRGEDIACAPDDSVLLQALERSCSIWYELQGSAKDATRIHTVLRSVLSNFKPAATAPHLPGPLVESSPWSQSDQYISSAAVFPQTTEMDIDWVSYLSLLRYPRTDSFLGSVRFIYGLPLF
jgi:hypothetical protein